MTIHWDGDDRKTQEAQSITQSSTPSIKYSLLMTQQGAKYSGAQARGALGDGYRAEINLKEKKKRKGKLGGAQESRKADLNRISDKRPKYLKSK